MDKVSVFVAVVLAFFFFKSNVKPGEMEWIHRHLHFYTPQPHPSYCYCWWSEYQPCQIHVRGHVHVHLPCIMDSDCMFWLTYSSCTINRFVLADFSEHTSTSPLLSVRGSVEVLMTYVRSTITFWRIVLRGIDLSELYSTAATKRTRSRLDPPPSITQWRWERAGCGRMRAVAVMLAAPAVCQIMWLWKSTLGVMMP